MFVRRYLPKDKVVPYEYRKMVEEKKRKDQEKRKQRMRDKRQSELKEILSLQRKAYDQKKAREK